MKKILALCLVVILCFALVGCKNNEDVVNDGNNPPVEDNQNQGNEDLGEEEEVSGDFSEEDNSEVTKTITYQKCKEPAVSDGKFCVKV